MVRTAGCSPMRMFVGYIVLMGSILACFGANDGDRVKDDFRRIRDVVADSNLTRPDRLMKLASLGDEFASTWRDTDYPAFGWLTDNLCGIMCGMDVPDSRKGHIINTLAMRALERPHLLPLKLEAKLVNYVTSAADANAARITGVEGAALRKRQAGMWLHAWKRLEDSYDANVDPNRYGPMSLADFDTNDPEIAKQMMKIKEEVDELARQAELQRTVLDLRKYWVPDAKRFLISRYMETDANAEELEGLLTANLQDRGVRDMIMAAVRAKKMPQELDLRQGSPRASTQLAK